MPRDAPDLVGYIDLALRGTFPEAALRISAAQRRRWYLTYADELVGRDVTALGAPDSTRLHRYLEALAASTAGVVSDTTLLDIAGIDRKTAAAYERLLTALHAVELVPAWSSRRATRLVRTPKRYILDPALGAAVLGVDARSIVRDGDLLGRFLDTFVAAQIRPELELMATPARLHHLRDAQGRHEIDLIIDTGSRGVVAIEVKADAGPGRRAARHLTWLRDTLDERFLVGVVLHTGPSSYVLDERIVAAPICALWT
ncbi:MAG: ATP-binding protein [Acidimicrobiales bacterium]